MKTLSLRPYPGIIRVCKSKKEYREQHKKLFGEDIDLTNKVGRMDGHGVNVIYLVWARDKARLAHEFSHVIFNVFRCAGIDPREANEEPFCYLLSQLLIEAG